MEIHHGCTCRACGRVLKRHRGKRSHCDRSACRHQFHVMQQARAESASARYPLQTLAMSHQATRL